MANVWPMTPPTCRENLAQLVPNWNSRGIPVTTPKTKVIPKTFAQNLAARLQSSRSFQTASDLEDYDQQSQTHRELWEQVMKCGGEGKLKTINGKSFHLSTSNLPGA